MVLGLIDFDSVLPVLDAVSDGVVVTDAEARPVRWNRAAEQLVGNLKVASTAELRCADRSRELRIDERPAVRALRGEDVDAAELVSCSPLHPDGLPLSATARALRGEGGAIRGALVVLRDMTEQRRREEDAPFRLLVEGVKDYAIVMLDADGRVASWNSGAARIMGYTSEEIVGELSARFYLAEDVEAGKDSAELRAAAASGRFEGEGWRVAKGGHPFWANVVLTVLHGAAGLPVGYAMVTSDITARRKFEDDVGHAHEQLRALAAHVNAASEQEKEHLAREVHDVLGQELTMLKLDAAWIIRRLASTPTAANDDVLARMASLTQQIDASIDTVRRIATGLRPRVLDDLGLVAAIDWQVRDFQTRSGISVALSVPELDSVDRDRATALFRILQEILTNIVRHAEARNVKVTLSKEEACLVLDVADDGLGMTAAQASSPEALGILGMRERATRLGGTFEIFDTRGEGTRTNVRMPVPRA